MSDQDHTNANVATILMAVVAALGVIIGVVLSVCYGKAVYFLIAFIPALLVVSTLARYLPTGLRVKNSEANEAMGNVTDALVTTEKEGPTAAFHMNPLAIAMASLFLSVGAVIPLSYYKLFWLIALVGLSAIVGYWSERQKGGFKAAIAFMGIFICLYGVLGTIVMILI